MASVLERWVEMLGAAELPVLARTAAEIDRVAADERSATPKRIVDVVLHDPIMTVRVLQYLETHRNRYRSADITTIAHALMMLGTSPFFAHFRGISTIEARLEGQSTALAGTRKVLSRSRHAALYAHDWARLRNDTDPEEVMVAALLHDLSEALMWCFAPMLAIEIQDRQREDSALRSDEAQRAVLGFRLLDLQLELLRAWHLPELPRMLMDDTRAKNPRVRNVAYACAVARHSSRGWSNLALPSDYEHVADLLRISRDEVAERVSVISLQLASEADWYGVAPLAPFETPWNEEAQIRY